MNSNEKKLDEICEILSSKRIYAKEYKNKGVPFYRSKEIIQKARSESISDNLYISAEKFIELNRKFGSPKLGDILMASIGANLGITYFVNTDYPFYFKDGNVIWFRNFCKNINSKFLYYWLNTKEGQSKILSSAIGSAQKALTIDGLKKIKLMVPLLEEQEFITSTVSCLDMKIELNNRVNNVLVEMTRIIFKYWFIDFEFQNEQGNPYKSSRGEFIDSEFGKIPKEWEIKSIEKVLESLESGSRPKGGIDKYMDGIPSIGAENILGIGLYDYNKIRFVPEEFYNKMSRGKIKNGDVLLYKDGAQIGRKSIFMHNFPFEKCCINEHVFILRVNENLCPIYLYLWLDLPEVTNKIINLNSNSAQPGINRAGVGSLKILVPKKEIIKKFNSLIEPFLQKLFLNCLQNRSLFLIRDALLPKLMTGRIRVNLEDKEES